MQTPFSPITHNKAIEIDKIEKKIIIELYSEIIKIDISKYFKDVDYISINKCSATGYRYYSPATVIGDALFYQLLSQQGDYTRPWAFDHQFGFDAINVDDKVLEIGCGNGEFLLKVRENKTNNVTGIELNEEMVKLCSAKGLNVQKELLAEHKKLNKAGYYDVICAFQVLEHINDVADFINDIIYCLKPNGKIILSTPNNDPYYMEYNKFEPLNLPPHHMGLWNKQSYIGVADFFNLEIRKIEYSTMPSFKGVVFQKVNQLFNGKIKKRHIFYFTMLVYATLYCGIKRLFKKYQGCYMVVQITRK